jgi:hypothetical protein
MHGRTGFASRYLKACYSKEAWIIPIYRGLKHIERYSRSAEMDFSMARNGVGTLVARGCFMKLIEQDEPLTRRTMYPETDPYPAQSRAQRMPLNQKRLHERVMQAPPAGIGREELEAHFRGMPASYWTNVTKAELVWGLETVHTFLAKLNAWDTPGAPAVASLRHCPERGFTKVMVCTLDRPGLVAKIAATFSALRINILQADVYTRADSIALDVFQVAAADEERPIDTERLQQLTFLLEGALNDPLRLVSAFPPGRVNFSAFADPPWRKPPSWSSIMMLPKPIRFCGLRRRIVSGCCRVSWKRCTNARSTSRRRS